jgi:hypothetical protein
MVIMTMKTFLQNLVSIEKEAIFTHYEKAF